MKKLCILMSALLLVITGGGLSDKLLAQTGESTQLAIGVTPAIRELAVEPGKPTSFKVTVSNITRAPVPVKSTASALVPFEDIQDQDKSMFDASGWFKVTEPAFILQPKQTREVAVTVLAPNGAEPGGHYATLFFQPLVPAQSASANTAYLGSKVGVLMLLVVKGNIERQLSLQDINVPLVQQTGPVDLNVPIKNSGTVHLMPTGNIEITDITGRRIDTIALPPTLVLPKTTKLLTVPWDNKGRIGVFKAKVTAVYGPTHTKMSAGSRGFWIVPWFWGGIIIFLLTAGGFVAWRTRGRWRRAVHALSHNNRQRGLRLSNVKKRSKSN